MALEVKDFEALMEKFKEGMKNELQKIIQEEIAKINFSEILKEQQEKCATLETENIKLKERIARQEKMIEEIRRKNNLVIFGVHAQRDENSDKLENIVLDLCNKTLDVKVCRQDLNYVRRLGRQGDEKRPILASFISNITKRDLLKNSQKLKNLKIYITEDLDKNTRDQRRELSQIRKKLYEQGAKEVKMRRNGLVIEGEFQHMSKLIPGPGSSREEAFLECDEQETDSLEGSHQYRQQKTATAEDGNKIIKRRRMSQRSAESSQQSNIKNFFRPQPEPSSSEQGSR